MAVPEKSSGRKVPKKVLPEMKRVNKSNRVEIEDFVCPQCDQPYSNQDLLDKHMKVHGSTDGQPPRKSVTIMQPTIKSEPVEPNEKSRRRRYGPFVCPECKVALTMILTATFKTLFRTRFRSRVAWTGTEAFIWFVYYVISA